jgi:hypothetical protein
MRTIDGVLLRMEDWQLRWNSGTVMRAMDEVSLRMED